MLLISWYLQALFKSNKFGQPQAVCFNRVSLFKNRESQWRPCQDKSYQNQICFFSSRSSPKSTRSTFQRRRPWGSPSAARHRRTSSDSSSRWTRFRSSSPTTQQQRLLLNRRKPNEEDFLARAKQESSIGQKTQVRNCYCMITEPGGLDVRDQSRSRSRTSIASRLTFENRQDYSSRRDRFLFYLCRDFFVEIKMCRDFYRDHRE